MLVAKDIAYDARVRRSARSLAAHQQVVATGTDRNLAAAAAALSERLV